MSTKKQVHREECLGQAPTKPAPIPPTAQQAISLRDNWSIRAVGQRRCICSSLPQTTQSVSPYQDWNFGPKKCSVRPCPRGEPGPGRENGFKQCFQSECKINPLLSYEPVLTNRFHKEPFFPQAGKHPKAQWALLLRFIQFRKVAAAAEWLKPNQCCFCMNLHCILWLQFVADFLCSYTLIHFVLQTIHLLFQMLNGISSR